jgi:hypothetical protein
MGTQDSVDLDVSYQQEVAALIKPKRTMQATMDEQKKVSELETKLKQEKDANEELKRQFTLREQQFQ